MDRGAYESVGEVVDAASAAVYMRRTGLRGDTRRTRRFACGRRWSANHLFKSSETASYIHWPDLDEDLTVAGLLAGQRLGREPAVFKKMAALAKGEG